MKKILWYLTIVTKFHKILIKTIQHRCDVLIYEKTCIRTGATVTLNASAIVKVWATKFHKILIETITFTAKTRSDRDFEMSLCYTPKAFSCLEEIKYNINHCLELAPSFPKMYNITMF